MVGAIKTGSRARVGIMACLTMIIGLVCLLAVFAPSRAHSQGEPVLQIGDQLDSAGMGQLLALYATELGSGDYGISPAIARLPCAARNYQFTATIAWIESSETEVLKAEVHVSSAHLPPGISCMKPMRGEIGRGSSIVVSSLYSNGASTAPSIYRSEPMTIESFVECISLESVCAGSYRLRADLVSYLGRKLKLGYVFEIKTKGFAIVKSGGGSSSERNREICEIKP